MASRCSGPTTLLTAVLALLAIAIVIGVRAFDDGTTIVTRRLTTPAGTTPVVARRTRSLPTDSSATSSLPEAPPTPTHVAWLSDPDYTFWTDATQIDDAFLGASDGAVIDAYGQELLDGVSQFFFRLSECLRDDVLHISYLAGETAYPRIEIDLQFSLGPGLPAFPSRKPGARMAEQRDIAYRLPDVSLPPIGPVTLSLCIQSAFERARFPERLEVNLAPSSTTHRLTTPSCFLLSSECPLSPAANDGQLHDHVARRRRLCRSRNQNTHPEICTSPKPTITTVTSRRTLSSP